MSDTRIAAPLPSRILLATDLSARCDRALDRAGILADEWDTELVALHVIEEAGALQWRSDTSAPSWRRPLEPLDIAQRQLRKDLQTSGRHLTTLVKEGDPAEVIARTAVELGCDLVVTGVARDETFGRFLLGTTVDRLLRRMHIPVLVVRERARAAYRNIVIATDFSDVSLGALRITADFFPGRPLNVFHVYQLPFVPLAEDYDRLARQYGAVAERECAEFLERFRAGAAIVPELRTWIEYGDVVPLIDEFVAEHDIDLLAFGTYGRNALAEAFIGSTATRILRRLPCDALVVPGGRRLRSS
jgi:nucleotide-binding universal stress UspA family protein